MRKIIVWIWRKHRDDRLAVGSDDVTQPRRNRRQRSELVSALEQEVQRSNDTCSNDHALGANRLLPFPRVQRVHRCHFVTAALERTDGDHLSFRENPGPELFRQVEIVLVETVLRAVATPRQAASAAGAAGSLRTRPIEEGIGFRLSRFAEVDPLGHGTKRIARAHRFRGSV